MQFQDFGNKQIKFAWKTIFVRLEILAPLIENEPTY